MRAAWFSLPLYLLVALTLVLFGLTACASDAESDGAPDESADESTDETDPSATPTPSDGQAHAATTVGVYFGNQDRGDPCEDVFPVERRVAAETPLRGALEALLAGPTDAERAEGYGGWFSSATEGVLRRVRIDDGTAHVDFADFSEIIPNASTSCGSALLLAQLNSTVEQFATVDEARYSFNGDEAAFYHWLQLGVPE